MHEPISDKGAGFRSLAPSDKKKPIIIYIGEIVS